VGEDGSVSDFWLVHPFSGGYDELAIAAVTHDKFSPAMKDGKPVKVRLIMEEHWQRF
jgi:hypothetical protein